MPSPPNKVIAGAIVLLGFALRAGVVWVQLENLSADPDNRSADPDKYWWVAEGIVEGKGFANRVTGKPTAFRPPLYPLLIAAGIYSGNGAMSLAMLQVVTGTATVWLTMRIGRRLGLGNAAAFAGLLVAVDPLLLQYTSQVMTETVFTFLFTAMLWAAISDFEKDTRPFADDTDDATRLKGIAGDARRNELRRDVLVGLLFGLCALCRPTIWPVGLLFAFWWFANLWRTPQLSARWRAVPWAMLLTIAVVVAPWVIRNQIALGKPIYSTTHGGYTLLLANNPLVYKHEVEDHFGGLWENAPPGETQQDWLRDLRARMAADLGENATEPEVDRWMYQQAFQTIRERPTTFLRACLLRFVRFWNVVPMGSAREGIPAFVVWGVGAFYTLELIGLLYGLARILRRDRARWMPILIAIVGFSLVHLVFWTNARMRAPVIPAIALVSAVGAKALYEAFKGPREASNGRATSGANS